MKRGGRALPGAAGVVCACAVKPAASARLVNKIEELIKEGNVRRIVIKQQDRTIAEFPLAVGVVGAVVAPILAAAGAIAALVTDCTIAVERVRKK